jgi:hypothetical protein
MLYLFLKNKDINKEKTLLENYYVPMKFKLLMFL